MKKFCLLLSALVSLVANAQLAPNYHRLQPPTNPPKVVFIGDYITYEWASVFAANPNWINQGDSNVDEGGSGSALARFQSDVVSLHPAIVHILVGAYDSYFVSDQSAIYAFQGFLSNLDAMVKEARAANIKVILGTTPPISTNVSGYVTQINAAIAAYGAAHNIPVIDYADALCGCASLSSGQGFFTIMANTPLMTTAADLPFPWDGLLPNTAGYAAMTQLAENAIATLNLKLVGGWLSDVGQGESLGGGEQINVNTVGTPNTVQFTPIGYYSDGSQHPLINTNMQDATGTWTSSNPVVMNINQKGLAWALSNGTTIIRYTSPTGVAFSEWIMYVSAPTD
jgi:lysophospholipase L1-like esterase